ncbi:hypothetical protein MUN89_07340 [Halobacillus salinarum]|uniref:DUF8042 domain-containing protein n=1 Tax=Halobacillus salinarum TaxID=2932257 RepID=A0ABY4ENT5_9BACI|nr:hypothetical protein [Halobacillus salinarum]UOQ45736.1 hypothetical protein MUN89_07340 [Halobacillus salinarum]
MTDLTVEQHHMLREYDRLLTVTSEGFQYLEDNTKEDAPPQVQQVFEDVLLSFQQMSKTHEQLVNLFQEDPDVKGMIDDFHEMALLLQEWFELDTHEEKQQLLIQRIVPAYESFREQMQLFVKPYIAH